MSVISDAIRDSKEIHFLVDLDFNGVRKRYSDLQLNIPRRDSSFPAYRFDGKITNFGSIINRFDLYNFKYNLQTVSITLANSFSETTDERLQDFETLRKLDGSIGKIYVWAPGLTWEDIEVNGLIFSGVFQKSYHNSNFYVFDLVDHSESRFGKVPNNFINDKTFSNFKKTASSGAGGKEQQIIFGDWPLGVKLECIDVDSFKYFMSSGYSKIAEDLYYPTATETLYAASGTSYTFSTSGVSVYAALDGLGNPYTYVQFPSDQSASEPISCSMEGILDSGTTVIEHPADIAKYVIDTYSNLKASEVDEGSLKEIKNIIPGLTYTSCFNSVISGAAAIDRLFSKILVARINKVGGKVGTMCLDFRAPVVARYTKEKHCVSEDITIRKTPYNLICNDLTVNYAVNVASGGYEKSIKTDSSNNEICKRSELDYGRQPEVVLTIPDIWDDSSVNILIDRYLSFYAYRHDLLEWEVSYEDGFDVIEGNVVEVTVPEGNSTRGQGWIEQRCILLQRELKFNTIKQVLWCISTVPGRKEIIGGSSGGQQLVLFGGEGLLFGGEPVVW